MQDLVRIGNAEGASQTKRRPEKIRITSLWETDRDWVLIRKRVHLLRSQELFRQQNKKPKLTLGFCAA